MAEFKSDNIVNQVNNETYIKIKNKQNIVRYTFYCDTISVIYASGNYVVIKTKSDNNQVKLDFDTAVDATKALTKINDEKAKAERNCESQDALTETTAIYDRDNGLLNNQNLFTLNDATVIKSVHVNGMDIEGFYEFDTGTKILKIRVNDLGWGINTTNLENDVIVIKYL